MGAGDQLGGLCGFRGDKSSLNWVGADGHGQNGTDPWTHMWRTGSTWYWLGEEDPDERGGGLADARCLLWVLATI